MRFRSLRVCLAFTGLCVVFLFSACRQDEDDLPPAVTITAPSGTLPDYNHGDVFYTAFDARDEGGIAQWTVRLSDESGRQRYTNGYQSVGNEPVNFSDDLNFTFEDVKWPSGDYTLGIFVRDAAGNEGAAFKTIRYFEAPLEREAVYVLRESAGQVFVDSLDANSTLLNATSYTGDIGATLANSWDQQLVIGGDETPRVDALLHPALLGGNSYTGQNPLNATFCRDLYWDAASEAVYAAFEDGFIRSFGENMVQQNAVQVTANFRPEQVCVEGDYLIASLRSLAQNQRVIAVFFRTTGALLNTFPVSGDIVAIEPFTNNRVIAFINNDDGSRDVIRIDPEAGLTVNTGWLIGDGTVFDALRLQDNFCATAQDDGVAFYTLGSGGYIAGSTNGVQAIDLSYDPTDGFVYAVDDANLYRINPNSGQIIQQWPAGSGVKAVEVLLNK